jgi:cytochrome P450
MVDFNPLDPEYQVNPYPHFDLLRRKPAIWVDSLNAWFVGRHRDIRAMAADAETFSHTRFAEISKGEFNYAPNSAQLNSTDAPDHTRLRTLSSSAFRPRRIRAMEEAIVAITTEYLEPIVAHGGAFDFHKALASRIPIHAITRMLGVPAEEGQTFRKWTADILSAANRALMGPDELAQIRNSVDLARAYFSAVITDRRRHPGDDMITAWTQAQEQDETLTDEEVLGLSILLLVGGDTTTAHLLSNTMIALFDHPDQYDAVRNDRSLIAPLIEEVLRYESPVQTVFWNTTREVDLGEGVVLPPDAAVIGVWSSANRDPERYENPDRLDVFREPEAHLAFGFGPHFCLGAVLARAEARIVLSAVFDELPNLKRANDTMVDWAPSYWIRGPRSLPVVA